MITINTNPSGTPSVHDAMWHVVSSDNSGQTDFKYVFDVYVNGVQKIRVKQYPEPDNGKGYFDAGPTVRNEMLYQWFEPINSSAYVAQPDMSGNIGITYALKVGEDVSGVTTLNMASADASGYNWAPPMFKRRVTTLQNKLNKWLTNRPVIMEIGAASDPTTSSENLFIGFYTDDNALNLRVQTYGFDNNLIADVSGVTSNGNFLQMNIGQLALYNELSIIIGENVKYYKVLFDGYQELFVYTKCNKKYNCIPVHFLNRWGVFDTLRFDLASRLSMDIERKGFGQRDYRFNGNSVDYFSSANRYYEGNMNYSNAANFTYKLNADAMGDADYEWAAELMVSPQILLEIDGYFYPATIKKTSFDYPKIINDKLKAFEVEFELKSTRYTQLR